MLHIAKRRYLTFSIHTVFTGFCPTIIEGLDAGSIVFLHQRVQDGLPQMLFKVLREIRIAAIHIRKQAEITILKTVERNTVQPFLDGLHYLYFRFTVFYNLIQIATEVTVHHRPQSGIVGFNPLQLLTGHVQHVIHAIELRIAKAGILQPLDHITIDILPVLAFIFDATFPHAVTKGVRAR